MKHLYILCCICKWKLFAFSQKVWLKELLLDLLEAESSGSCGGGDGTVALQLVLHLCSAVILQHLRDACDPHSVWNPAAWAAAVAGASRGGGRVCLSMMQLPARVMRVASDVGQLQVLARLRTALQAATLGGTRLVTS